MSMKRSAQSFLKSPFTWFFRNRSTHRSMKPSEPSVSSSGSNDDVLRVFSFFDKNGDGKISSSELKSCISTLGTDLSKEDVDAVIALLDSDGDGLLSVDDLRKVMEDSSGEREELRKAFEMYSTEPGSGCISPCSLKRMMSRLGESKSIEDCKAMIRPFDINGDGFLSFDEFSLMMR